MIIYVFFLSWSPFNLYDILCLKEEKKRLELSYQTHEQAKHQSSNDEKDVRTPCRNSKSHCEIVVKVL